MKKSGTIFLSKIAAALVVCLFFKNVIVYLVCLLYVLSDGFRDALIFAVLLLVINTGIRYRYDFIPAGVVEKVSEKSLIVDKGLYRVHVYGSSFSEGDLVFFMGSKQTDTDDEKINNVLFACENEGIESISNPVRRFIENRCTSLSERENAVARRVLFNDSTADLVDLGYGFFFYYSLMAIYRKRPDTAAFICITYIFLFGNEIRLLWFWICFLSDKTKMDRINRLSLRIIAVMILNPALLKNYSFLISIVFSLVSLMGYRKGTLPLMLIESYFFKKVSLLRMLFLPALMSLRILIFTVTLVCFVVPFLSILLYVPYMLMPLFDYADRISIRGSPDISVIVILIVLITVLKIKNDYLKSAIFCVILLLPVSQIFPGVDFVDVGQGDSVYLHSCFGTDNILIDTGSPFNYSKLKDYLYSRGVYRIDKIILSHEDADHSGNIDNLQKDFIIGEIIKDKVNVDTRSFHLFELDTGNYDNINAGSLVHFMEFKAFRFLFTGDITKTTEKRILETYNIPTIDVLKVSHHGSDTATSDLFISRITPRFAVISTSGMYDHPKPSVIDVLDSYKVKTFVTKDCGTVRFVFSPFGNFVKTGSANFVIIY